MWSIDNWQECVFLSVVMVCITAAVITWRVCATSVEVERVKVVSAADAMERALARASHK